MIWLSSRASSDLGMKIKVSVSRTSKKVIVCLPFGQCFIAWIELVIVEVGSCQEHLDLCLSLLEADLLLEVALLLLVNVRDSDFCAHEFPEDLLEGNETAITRVNGRPHGRNVHHHLDYFSAIL